MPNMTVQNGSTVVNAVGDILFFAEQPNGKYTYILTLSAVSWPIFQKSIWKGNFSQEFLSFYLTWP